MAPDADDCHYGPDSSANVQDLLAKAEPYATYETETADGAVADPLDMRRAPDTDVQAFKATASECESPEALWKWLSGWIDLSIGGPGNGRASQTIPFSRFGLLGSPVGGFDNTGARVAILVRNPREHVSLRVEIRSLVGE